MVNRIDPDLIFQQQIHCNDCLDRLDNVVGFIPCPAHDTVLAELNTAEVAGELDDVYRLIEKANNLQRWIRRSFLAVLVAGLAGFVLVLVADWEPPLWLSFTLVAAAIGLVVFEPVAKRVRR